MMKKLIRLCFAAACMFSLLLALPTVAHAANYGTSGSVSWSLYSGNLHIYGNGAMANYGSGGAPWYDSKQYISSITVSEGVTHIGTRAFDFLYNVTSVSLPSSSLTSIGDAAFSNCTRLSGTLTLPDSVTSIGRAAFWNTKSLSVVDGGTSGNITWKVSNRVLTITGSGAMPDYATYSDAAPWIGYVNGGVDSIVIGEGITHIGSTSFYGSSYNTTLNSISLPSTLKSIGEHAFEDLNNITSITIPGSVTSIGSAAFAGCTDLTSITLKSGITEIGNSMFAECTSLTSITLPSTLERIGDYAFSRCTSLTSINLPASLKYIGAWVFESTYGVTIGSLPSGLKHIGNYAFSNCKFTSVTLPPSIECIGFQAFPSYDVNGNELIINGSGYTGNLYWNVSGSKLTVSGSGAMPDYYTDANPNAPWHGMSRQITTVELDSRITSIGAYAFYNMDVATMTLPSGLTRIGEKAFYDSALTEISLPSGLKYIGDSAFMRTGLTTLAIPDSVTEIGGQVVDTTCSSTGLWIIGTEGSLSWKINGSKLIISGTGPMPTFEHDSSAKYNIDTVDAEWWKYRTLVTEVVISEGITDIGTAAFYKFTKLTSVTLPSTLTEIKTEAFRSTALKSITLPDKVQTIGYNAFGGTLITSIRVPASMTTLEGFSNMYSLREIIIPDPSKITVIGNSAFYGCSLLSSFEIPETVTTIGSSAFSSCSVLKEITIPESVTKLPTYAFSYCSALTTVSLPDTLTYIDSYAFNNCTSLTSIIIPDSVETISAYAFQKCTALKDITFTGSAPDSIATNAFTGVTSNVTYTPNASWSGKIQNYGGKLTWVKINGSCGDGANWRLEDETILKLYGAGTTAQSTWTDYTASVHTVVIAADVEGINADLLSTLPKLTTLIFEGPMPNLAAGAFNGVSGCGYYPHGQPSWTDEALRANGGALEWSIYCSAEGSSVRIPMPFFKDMTAPTCTVDGNIEYWYCGLCNAAFTASDLRQSIPAEDLILPATGHAYGEPAFGWAEDSSACSVSFTCASCSDVQTLNAAIVSEQTSDPTCTEPGSTAYTASADFEGIVYSDSVVLYDIPAMGHVEIVIPGFDATCTETGLSDEIFCDTCGETLKELEEIPALGHTDSVTIEALEPTCAVDGHTEEHSCSVCGELLSASEIIPATGLHTDSVTIEALEPTCTADGHTAEHRCSVCNELLVASETVPATRHTYAAPAFAWAEDGSACTANFACVHQDDIQTVEAEISSETVLAASCTEMGDTLYTASLTFESAAYQDILTLTDIPATGHTEVEDARVEPTNREPGLTEGSHCSVCGTVLVAQNEIPALFTYDDDTIIAYNGESTDVLIPEDAAALSNTLFKNNTTVTSVRVPDNITTVGTQTFYGCTSMQDIWLPDAISGIGTQTFYKTTGRIHANAGSATAVALSFRSTPFYVEDGYTLRYRVTSATGTPSGVWIIGCDLNQENIVIPADFAGTAVTQIESGAFAGLDALRRVWIPTTAGTIAADAFDGCAEDLIIRSAANAYARTWATANGYTWEHDQHTPETVAKVEPTCTDTGLTEGFACSGCGEILTAQEIIPALGHTEVIDEASAPTCTATGLTEGKHCSVCNEVILAQETVPALGHTEVIDEASTPSCTDAGLTEGKHCSVCNEVILAQEVIPAIGHTEVIDEASAPTCTDAGLTEGKHCSVCNEVILAQEVVPALGHSVTMAQAVYETTVGSDLIVKVDFACGHGSEAATNWLSSDPEMLSFVGVSTDATTADSSAAAFAVNAPGIAAITVEFENSSIESLSCAVLVHSDKQLTLPAALTELDAEAFLNAPVQEIILPEGLVKIGERAFADCTELVLVHMPDSISDIAANAFDGCTNVTFLCTAQSSAAIFAAEHGIPCFTVQ